MATPSYRDRVRPALIDPSVIDTGESAAARSLASAFKSFEQLSGGVLGNLRSEEGRRAGAEAGRTEAPNFREGLASLTAYGQAYNDAATRSYAIKAEIAADEAGARIESEAGTDPATFRKNFGVWRDNTIKNAPVAARTVLNEVYDRRMAAGVQRIAVAQQAEIKEQDRGILAEGIQRRVDAIARLRATNDPVAHVLAEEEEAKLELLIDGARGDGTISEVDATAHRMESDRSIIQQTVLTRFKNELDDPYGNPIAFIERLRESNKTSEALAPEDEEKLLDALVGELQQRSALESAGRTRENAERQARFDAGNQSATSLLLGRQLTQNKLKEMVDSEDLDPNRATTLANELQSGDTAKSDPRTLFDYEINLLDYEEDDISTERGLVYDDRARLILKRREWASGWRGTQEGREGADRLDRALGIPPGLEGKLLSGETKDKRERALSDWYNEIDALPPAERQRQAIPIAEEVVSRVIKNETVSRLEKKRKARVAVEREWTARGELTEKQRKARDEQLAGIDAAIQKLEQQAK